jgi:hypothetical protein
MSAAIRFIVPMIVEVFRHSSVPPIRMAIVYGLFNHIVLQLILIFVLSRITIMKKSPWHYFIDDNIEQVLLIMEFTNIVLYSLILSVIEFFPNSVRTNGSKRNDSCWKKFFKNANIKHPVTIEAHIM